MDRKGWTVHDKEGIANMRRAVETLKPGDVIRYCYDTCPLILVTRIEATSHIENCTHIFSCIRMAFRGDQMDKRVKFALHGDWELLGHIDDWQALVDA